MNCERIRERLHLSLDGEPADAALREHLSACRACCAELAGLRQSVTALRSLPRAAAPRGLLAGVMTAVWEQPLPDRRRRGQRRNLSALAAALAMMGLLLLAVAAGDVWRMLSAPPPAATAAAALAEDGAALAPGDAEDVSVLQPLHDPVLLAEQLPAAAEQGGAAFVGGLCLLFIAAATALLSLLLPVQRPAPNAGVRPAPLHIS